METGAVDETNGSGFAGSVPDEGGSVRAGDSEAAGRTGRETHLLRVFAFRLDGETGTVPAEWVWRRTGFAAPQGDCLDSKQPGHHAEADPAALCHGAGHRRGEKICAGEDGGVLHPGRRRHLEHVPVPAPAGEL